MMAFIVVIDAILADRLCRSAGVLMKVIGRFTASRLEILWMATSVENEEQQRRPDTLHYIPQTSYSIKGSYADSSL